MSSSGAIEAHTRAYYDRIAGDYDRHLDTPENWEIRRRVWEVAEALAPRHARILDFGAGTGLDAEHFAGLGHNVTAYDTSEGMVEVLRRRCSAQIAAGRIAPLTGSLAAMRPALVAGGPYDVVLCNFAVFSLLPRLDDTFRLFGETVPSGGAVVICMQNPWWPGEVRLRQFWGALARMPFTGVIRYAYDGSGQSFRHTIGQVRRAARPELRPDPAFARAARAGCFGRFGAMKLVVLQRS
jgi:SAM-dependent methyltransferase